MSDNPDPAGLPLNERFSHLQRTMETPPGEAYEGIWRDAIAMLEALGPDPGFLLLVVNETPIGYETAFSLSSGQQKIPPDVIEELAVRWINGELA